MNDILVKLWSLPTPPPWPDGVSIRRALPPERGIVTAWVARHFSPAWADEASVALAQIPSRCLVAIREARLLGFACYDTTFKGFLGPIGVDATLRGGGVGSALTREALEAMRQAGYAYAIIGATRANAFYESGYGGMPVADSWPGAYSGLLKPQEPGTA